MKNDGADILEALKRAKAALKREPEPREILYTVDLKNRPRLGKTNHRVEGKIVFPMSLLISFRPASNDFRLEYQDRDGDFITDTWHATLAGAFQQAEFEFGAIDDWENKTSPDK